MGNTVRDRIIADLTSYVMGEANIKESYHIVDYDLDNVFIDIDDCDDSYTIRMWDITEYYIRYSLFKDVENYGIEIISSKVFSYNVNDFVVGN